jgi:ECF transporter S component (folate family)
VDQNKEVLMPKVKKVVLAGLLLAILIVFQRFISVPLTQFLRVNLAYVPLILIGTFLGPVWGALIGVAGDLLGMILFPTASFFPGFTLNALLIGIIYGSLLYNRPNNKSYLIRLIISVLIVRLFVNLGLNTLWLSILYEQAFMVLVIPRLTSTLIQIPIQIGSMYAIKLFLDKPFKKYLLDEPEDAGDEPEDPGDEPKDAGDEPAEAENKPEDAEIDTD